MFAHIKCNMDEVTIIILTTIVIENWFWKIENEYFFLSILYKHWNLHGIPINHYYYKIRTYKFSMVTGSLDIKRI